MAVVEGKAKVTLDSTDPTIKLEKLEKQVLDFKRQLVDLRKQPILDNTKIKAVEGALKKVQKEVKEVRIQTISYQKVLNNLKGTSLKELQAAYRKLNIETSKLDRTTTQYKKNAANMARIRTEIAKVRGEMRGAGTAAKGFGANMKNIASQMFAGGGIIAAVFAFVRLIKGGFKIILNFGKAVSGLGAITGRTTDELSGLTKQAKELGATTAHTATQVIEMQTELARLGFSLREIEDATPAMLDLASAVGVNLADAAQVAGGIIRAFALDTSETKDVVDALVATTNNSGAAFEDYREAVKLSAPIFKAANIDFRTMNLLIGKLADSQIKGSIAGTGLKNLISKLSDESSSLSKELGFSVKNSDDLVRAFKVLKERNIDLTKATELTDERSKAAFLTLIEGVDSADKLALALENLDDNARKTSKAMLDNLSGDATKMKSAWEGFVLSLEDGQGAFTKVSRAITQKGTDILGVLTSINDTSGTTSDRIDRMAEAAENTSPGIKFLSEKFGELLTWLSDVVPGVGFLIQKFKELIGITDSTAKKLTNLRKEEEKLKETTKKTTETVKELSEEEKKLAKQREKDYKERLKANQQLQDQIKLMNVQLIEDERQRAIEEVEIWEEKERRKIESSKASAAIRAEALESLEAVHKQKLQDIDDNHNEKLLDKFNKIQKFLVGQQAQLEQNRDDIIARDLQAISDKFDKQIELAREAAEQETELKDEFLQQAFDLEIAKDEALKAHKEEKELEHAQNIRAIREEFGLVTDEEKLDEELALLLQFYDEELLSEEEFYRARAQLFDDFNKNELAKAKKQEEEKLKLVKKGIQETQAITQVLGDFISAAKEQELADAGDNEEKKKEILKRYADKEFAVKAAQILASTAQAVMAALAQLGPIAGPIAAGFIGATGLAQLIKANSERQRIKGLESGGKFPVTREQDGKRYNADYGGGKRGYINRPTVLVGEENKREFVVSNKSLQNPDIERTVSAIDSYQRGQGLKYFNYQKVIAATGAIKGLQEGGEFGTTASTATATEAGTIANETNALLIMLLEEFRNFTDEISTWQSELKAFVLLDEIQDAEEEMSTLQTEVRL